MWVAGLPKLVRRLIMLAVPTMVLLVLSNPTRIRRIMAILPGTSKDRMSPIPSRSTICQGAGPGWPEVSDRAPREKWNHPQAVHTDYFAIVGEEFDPLALALLCLGLLIWACSAWRDRICL